MALRHIAADTKPTAELLCLHVQRVIIIIIVVSYVALWTIVRTGVGLEAIVALFTKLFNVKIKKKKNMYGMVYIIE